MWVNGAGQWNFPKDSYAFRGAGEQNVFVVPSHDLVVVRMGHSPGSQAGLADLNRAQSLLLEAIPRR